MSESEILADMASRLPSFESLPDRTPRYPNLWFHIEGSDPDEGRERVWSVLEKATGMVDDLPDDHGAEGSDEWARHRHLEPIELADGRLSHDHQLHLRIYNHGLGDLGSLSVGGRTFIRSAVSVHYEVDEPHPLHPYVDECPLCGCVGPFANWMDADRHGKNVWVHDPLGLELAVDGTVGGRPMPEIPGLGATEVASSHLVLGTEELKSIGIDGPRLDLFLLETD